MHGLAAGDSFFGMNDRFGDGTQAESRAADRALKAIGRSRAGSPDADLHTGHGAGSYRARTTANPVLVLCTANKTGL